MLGRIGLICILHENLKVKIMAEVKDLIGKTIEDIKKDDFEIVFTCSDGTK